MRNRDVLGQGTVWVAVAAAEVGLLQRLAAGPGATAAELAAELDLDPHACAQVCHALHMLGFVNREGERYVSTAFRVRGKEIWQQLPAYLRSGERMRFIDEPDERGAAYSQAVTMLSRRSRPMAQKLAEVLAPVETILDVGTGGGVWSLSMAERLPTTRVIGVDLPEVVPCFVAMAEELGLSDRVSAIDGSYFDVELPADNDRVILANVLHLETPSDAALLVQRCAAVVKPGGELVVIGCMPSDSEEARLFHAFYSIHLGMRTAKGGVHCTDLVESWCAAAGFGERRLLTFDALMPGGGALVCRRAA